MYIELQRGIPGGLDFQLVEVTDDEDYDLLIVKGPKQRVEFAIDALTPGYGLLPMETQELPGSDLYRKAAFVPKGESKNLKQALFSLFARAQGTTNN